MPSQSALQELADLIKRTNEELHALFTYAQENNQVDPSLISAVLRTLHTLKGTAAMCERPLISKLSHALEARLQNLMRTNDYNEKLFSLLNQANASLQLMAQEGEKIVPKTVQDLCTKLLQDLEPPSQKPPTKPLSLQFDLQILGLQPEDIEKINDQELKIISGLFNQNKPIYGYLVHLKPKQLEENVAQLEEKIKIIGNLITILPTTSHKPSFQYAFIALFTSQESEEKIQETMPLSGKLSTLQKEKVTSLPPELSIETIKKEVKMPLETKSFVRVNLDQIDSLIDQSNHLLFALSDLHQHTCVPSPTDTTKIRIPLDDHINLIEQILKQLQQNILALHLEPASELLKDLETVAQQTAREEKEKVAFVATGHDLLIDTNILEKLREPLLHLVRNAVGHGIQSPQKRKAVGKMEQGTVTLTLERTTEGITITLHDDGQGLDISAIRKRVIELGLLTPPEAMKQTDQQLFHYLFYPGFTTMKTATEISGRGIGLDTVKKSIDLMRGTISINSIKEQGTTITITIPSTLCLQRLLHFTAAEKHFAIPLANITEVLPYVASKIQQQNNKLLYRWHDKSIPAYKLSDLLHLTDISQADQKQNLIILEKNDQTVAIIIDTLVGQKELIVRPLETIEQQFSLFTGHIQGREEQLVLLIDSQKLWEYINNEQKRTT
jgi:two-component system chemotaxis sensor kinase CheA